MKAAGDEISSCDSQPASRIACCQPAAALVYMQRNLSNIANTSIRRLTFFNIDRSPIPPR